MPNDPPRRWPMILLVLVAVVAGLAGARGVVHLGGLESFNHCIGYEFGSWGRWCGGRPLPWREWRGASDKGFQIDERTAVATNWPLVVAALGLGAFGPAALLTLVTPGPRSRRPLMAATALRAVVAGGLGGVLAAAGYVFWLRSTYDLCRLIKAPGWVDVVVATDGARRWLAEGVVGFTWSGYSWATAAGALLAAVIVVRRAEAGAAGAGLKFRRAGGEDECAAAPAPLAKELR